jgi:quercetin dioxygenase-like cupin family protein
MCEQRAHTLLININISREGLSVFKKVLVAAAIAVPLIAVAAVAQQPANKRTPLQTVDFPAGYNVISFIAEIPEGCVGRHTHPGVESTYVMEGEGILKVEGQPDRTIKVGESFQVPPGVPHDACAAKGHSYKSLATLIVEKGKPAASPAP